MRRVEIVLAGGRRVRARTAALPHARQRVYLAVLGARDTVTAVHFIGGRTNNGTAQVPAAGPSGGRPVRLRAQRRALLTASSTGSAPSWKRTIRSVKPSSAARPTVSSNASTLDSGLCGAASALR